MPTAKINGIDIVYEEHGEGPPLLMLAPGGFDSTIEKWKGIGVWGQMDTFATLGKHFRCIAYDRREAGRSGGRIEHLSWGLYADEGVGLLDHLGIDRAFVLGGCMGCSVATALGARHPERALGLMLHWPVGGYSWKTTAGPALRPARRLRARGRSAGGGRGRARQTRLLGRPARRPLVRGPLARRGLRRRLREAEPRPLHRAVAGQLAHPVRPRHRGRRRARGAGGDAHPVRDHPRRRPGAPALGGALPQRAAAGGRVLERAAAGAGGHEGRGPADRVRQGPQLRTRTISAGAR